MGFYLTVGAMFVSIIGFGVAGMAGASYVSALVLVGYTGLCELGNVGE